MKKPSAPGRCTKLSELINGKKAFVFDFDGVLADSVEVKTEAFAELYRPYGQSIMNKVVEHHRANGGMSRFEKFRRYHSEFLGVEVKEEDVERLSAEFSGMVVNKVVNSPEIPGATDFLKKYCAEKACCVNSGTPENEMRDIIRQKKWGGYFELVCGSPTGKLENLNKITEYYPDLSIGDYMFFGDALSDLDAANRAGMDFIGIGNMKESILAGKVPEDRLIEDFLCLFKK